MVLNVRLEDLGLIGNCQYSALIDRSGSVAWCCLPRFDSDPVFSSLLDEADGGRFLVGPAGGESGKQRYIPNTNVLETEFVTNSGRFRVIDFAPRMIQFDRAFRPTQLHRIVEPLDGTPQVRVECAPKLGWSKRRPEITKGSHHVRFEGFESQLRLTTDIPISYLGGKSFALTERRHLVLTWGAPVEEPLAALCERFWNETTRYWQQWVKHCEIPPLFQQEVIRSALALKLHCFEDTGAIIASMTTSIPEAPGSGRTWDYRYCWLRDAYYVLGAFGTLGQFEEREQFVSFLLNVASAAPNLSLAPLYRVDGSGDLDEFILEDWPGYEKEQPVRVGNGAATQAQNDVFGEMVLALTPIFLDERFGAERSPAAFKLIEALARKAIAVAGTPDAGIWEFRKRDEPQTFSGLMCWAAADRMAKIAERLDPPKKDEFRQAAEKIRKELIDRAWDEQIGSFVGHYGGSDLDASLLQMATLRFLPPDDQRVHHTVDTIRKQFDYDGWLYRYTMDDGLGRPDVAFVICTFWLVEALASLGRKPESTAALQRIYPALSPLGLISEDFAPASGRMWGNFPQAYSHVGMIRAAFAASPAWVDVL